MSNLYPAGPYEFDTHVPAGLSGDLQFVDGAEEVLPQDFVQQVEGCLTFDSPSLTPMHAMGRSYFLPLPQRLGTYDALQVSGGGYVDNGIRSMRNFNGNFRTFEQPRVIKPLRAAFETFEGGGTSYIDDDGNIQNDYPVGVLGTYVGTQAEVKTQKTHEVWQRVMGEPEKLIVPRVIGKFVYDLADGQGGSQTAVLSLVPNAGLRLDHDMRVGEFNIISEIEQAAQEEQIREVLRQEFPVKLRALGFGLAQVHDMGYAHNQKHLGNVAAVTGEGGSLRPFIADWDTSRRPANGVKHNAQSLDLAQINMSVVRWLEDLHSRFEIPAFWGALKALTNATLQGYADYYGHPEPDSLKFAARDVVEHTMLTHGVEGVVQFFRSAIKSAKTNA